MIRLHSLQISQSTSLMWVYSSELNIQLFCSMNIKIHRNHRCACYLLSLVGDTRLQLWAILANLSTHGAVHHLAPSVHLTQTFLNQMVQQVKMSMNSLLPIATMNQFLLLPMQFQQMFEKMKASLLQRLSHVRVLEKEISPVVYLKTLKVKQLQSPNTSLLCGVIQSA